jgi:hypothetical protein
MTNGDNRSVILKQAQEEFLELAVRLSKGGMNSTRLPFFLHKFSSVYRDELSESVIDEIIDDSILRSSKNQSNVMDMIWSYLGETRGVFTGTELYNSLQMGTREEKAHVRTCLYRLEKAKKIERTGRRVGEYRVVVDTTEEIVWWEKNKQPMDLKLFFDLEQWVKPMPMSVNVIAGSPDSGKTALLLNIAIDNCERFKVRYLSSEMGDMELGERLILHDDFDEERFRKIDFRECAHSFSDNLLGEGITIVDYVEISDNFFMVADELKKLRDKSGSGIVFVGLQRKEGADAGRGGDFSLEKPRLYLNLDRNYPDGNKLTIRKAKNWRDPERNPNFLVQHFKIVKGINLVPIGVWKPEEE